ncbi:MAG: hypothetical protein WCD79_02180 [Chthoniobacteraceae bacterium]
MHRNSLTFITAIAAFLLTATLHAGIKVVPTPFPPHHTVIGAISADSITVTTANGSKTYKIDKYTTISFMGRTVTTNDLKAGMKVTVSFGGDPTTVASINASNPPIDPPPPPDNVMH